MKLCQDTLYIAVNIVDRVLDVMQASRDYLQLLGITTILIASKLVSAVLMNIRSIDVQDYDIYMYAP